MVTTATDNQRVAEAEASINEKTQVERVILGIAALFLLVNVVSLSVARGEFRLGLWTALAAWGVCSFIGHQALHRWLPARDPLLFPIVMFLSGWGLVVIDRLAPNFGERQTIWLLLSVTALLATALIRPILRWLREFRYLLLVAGLLLLVSTILLGTNPSGQLGAPELWLGFGAVFFQPSEPLKIILVAFLASYLGEQYRALRSQKLVEAGGRRLYLSPRIFGPILLMWGISVVMLVWQRDLGTAILFFAVFMLLLYVASTNALILLSGAGLIVIAGIAAYARFDVVQLRVDIWLNPWTDPDGRAFQIVQSLYAFAAGGVFGQGVGLGSPTYIPVVHSDFAFAAVAEEWGLLGVIVVIVCIAILITRGFRVAVRQTGRAFNVLLAIGLCTVIAVQSLLIMGGVLKLIPLTGVTLPYLSYGGSSLLTQFVIAGLLLRLSSGES